MAWKVNSCCWCLPLRIGLLAFGYIKSIISYYIILNLLFRINDVLERKDYFDAPNYVSISLGFGMSIIEFIFNIVLLAGLHKRSPGLLEHYFSYIVVMLGVQMAGAAFYIPLQVHRKYSMMGTDGFYLLVFAMCFAAVIILFQSYLVVLIYSVMSEMAEEKTARRQMDCEAGHTTELQCRETVKKKDRHGEEVVQLRL